MGWKFESNAPHQIEAISSAVDLFDGQTPREAHFSMVRESVGLGATMTETGIANSELTISEDRLLANIKQVQKRNLLSVSDDSRLKYRDFTIEMETGTGKTYVYVRSMLELNKKYGFRKFIIVVPSIAILEGVFKSLEMTKEHFEALYPGQRYRFFKYNSQNLNRIDQYASSSYIEIMIINIDSFRKSFDDPDKENKANLIHRNRENGIPPAINVIQETRPIVIIDEPQSVDNTPKAKEAIKSLKPLFNLRYSATHREKYYPVFKLDPVDAYQRRLVKRIEVKSIIASGNYNLPYIKLLKVDNKAGTFTAKLELDIKDAHNIKRKAILAKSSRGSQPDLFKLSNEREVYQGIKIERISTDSTNRHIQLIDGTIIKEGEVVGEDAGLDIKRFQIKATIEQHLDKELALLEKGIKVLSLFFIDKVANYRIYTEAGEEKGPYAKIFEEEYEQLLKLKKYEPLRKNPYIIKATPSEAHNGYFAMDNKKQWKDTREDSEGNIKGNSDELEDTFKLIMQDKERLVSFDSKLRFIFSHSALKEGWDNPNIFQICTLVETKDSMTKRQKIGRGLRLAVNQKKERVHDPNLNILTVVANESYQQFADTLQKEIESETGVHFEKIEDSAFYNIAPAGVDPIQWSKGLITDMRNNGYLDEKGKISDKLKEDLHNNALKLDIRYQSSTDRIQNVIKSHSKKLDVFNADERVGIRHNKRIYGSKEFEDLWARINPKTVYQTEFKTEELISKCIERAKDPKWMPKMTKRTAIERKDIVKEITRAGLESEQVESERLLEITASGGYHLPDIVTYLQESTALKRKTIIDILTRCGRLDEFKQNPAEFMEHISNVIKKTKNEFIIQGIAYLKTGERYQMQEIFSEDLKGYLKQNAIEVKNSVFDYVEYDSDTEKKFALDLDSDERVKVYMKLPSAFSIQTPFGGHTPDWALLMDEGGEEKLYLVVETKGSEDPEELRTVEGGKIHCAEKHFEAAGNKVKYEGLVTDFKKLQERIIQNN